MQSLRQPFALMLLAVSLVLACQFAAAKSLHDLMDTRTSTTMLASTSSRGLLQTGGAPDCVVVEKSTKKKVKRSSKVSATAVCPQDRNGVRMVVTGAKCSRTNTGNFASEPENPLFVRDTSGAGGRVTQVDCTYVLVDSSLFDAMHAVSLEDAKHMLLVCGVVPNWTIFFLQPVHV